MEIFTNMAEVTHEIKTVCNWRNSAEIVLKMKDIPQPVRPNKSYNFYLINLPSFDKNKTNKLLKMLVAICTEK